ncbi:MAG: hypothetical protein JWN03_8755 [Nocardia sp.]|uniref:hypothetical protein n=1 Tax=Nocardia sp. TaxID=1821 RepID=UPI002632A99A|nr:hypothetical protein [Nocardia sp.]MCU1648480.1 hypothetical protein [Nocardia sp.]
MRVRALVITSALAGVTIAGLVGAGTASAATPFVIPDAGAAGLELSPGETQSLSSGPIPALVDRYVPSSSVSVGVRPDSKLPQDEDYVFGGLGDVIGEAANRPGGSVDVLVDSGGLVVLQQW